jgi:hypothetical protein
MVLQQTSKDFARLHRIVSDFSNLFRISRLFEISRDFWDIMRLHGRVQQNYADPEHCFNLIESGTGSTFTERISLFHIGILLSRPVHVKVNLAWGSSKNAQLAIP